MFRLPTSIKSSFIVESFFHDDVRPWAERRGERDVLPNDPMDVEGIPFIDEDPDASTSGYNTPLALP